MPAQSRPAAVGELGAAVRRVDVQAHLLAVRQVGAGGSGSTMPRFVAPAARDQAGEPDPAARCPTACCTMRRGRSGHAGRPPRY